MDAEDAAALIRPAVPGPGGTWAELGAGAGTFTRALAALLGPGGHVYAVDRDPWAVRALQAWAQEERRGVATVTPVLADFTQPLPPHALGEVLDGVLAANALHFVDAAAQAEVLARIAAAVRPGAASCWWSTRGAGRAAGCRSPCRSRAFVCWRRRSASRNPRSSAHDRRRSAAACTRRWRRRD